MNEWEFSIEISTAFYGDLRRTDVSPEGAIREMIDNSTGSYEDHRDVLDRIVNARKCQVWITWTDDKIEVQDNAFGMNREGLQRAFQLSQRAESYSETNRGEYGLGLKYGALALGSKYTVDSIEYNSGKRLVSTLDSDIARTEAPKKSKAQEYDVMDNLHGTKIVIEGLNEYKYNSYFNKQRTLDNFKRKIAVIYADDIRHNRLDVFFNNERISEWDPVWQKDANGNEVLRHFTGEFEHNGKTYVYSGFVGQLSTASVAGAGFSLLQKRRAIEINYRPQELFGQSNDFRYQRLYGEIQLQGKSWIVSFTKSKLKFDEGIEELFIQSLCSCKEIKEVQKFAKNFRKGKEGKNLSSEDIKRKQKESTKQINKQQNSGDSLEKRSEEKMGSDANSIGNDPNVLFDTPGGTAPKNGTKPELDDFVVPEPQEPKEEYIDFVESDEGHEYKFSVKDEPSQTDGKFYKLVRKNNETCDYFLYVDSHYGLFETNAKNSNEKYFNIQLAIKLALAQILAEGKGVKKVDSQIYVDILNKLWGK